MFLRSCLCLTFFFFPLFPLLCSLFSFLPFPALVELFDALLSHEAGREADEKNGSAIFLARVSSNFVTVFSSSSSSSSCFCELFFLLVRYYSPFFHRPQSFSATFRFASQRRFREKCNKWLLFVNRHKVGRIKVLSV